MDHMGQIGSSESSSSHEQRNQSPPIFSEQDQDLIYSKDLSIVNFNELLRKIAHLEEHHDEIIHVILKEDISFYRASQVLRNYHGMEMVKAGSAFKKLNVKMKIGDEIFPFMVANSYGEYVKAKCQIFIETDPRDYPETDDCRSYYYISYFLDDLNGDLTQDARVELIKLRAQIILDLIHNPKPHLEFSLKRFVHLETVSGEVEEKAVFGPQQKRAAIALIVFTMVAEVAVPQDWCPETNGRSLTGDKVALALLRLISEGKYTFAKIFNKIGGYYLPSREGGTQLMRDFERFRQQGDLPDDIYQVYCQAMSSI